MAAPGAIYDPLNPYKSISPPTWEPTQTMRLMGGAPGITTAQFGAADPWWLGQTPLPNTLHRMRGGKVSRTMQHRAGGGGVQRTRQFAPGTAAVPYSTGGKYGTSGTIVSGGTGAAPALPGRIGYRGRLTSGTPANDGINSEKQFANQQALNQGARKEIDPVTGLSQNPTQNEINAQIQMLAGKGDAGAPQGLGGTRQAQAVGEYYDARTSGDPVRIAAATKAVSDLKDQINPNRMSNSQQPQQPVAGASGVQNVPLNPNAFPDAPAYNPPNTLGQQMPPPQTGVETGYEDQTPGLKKGGAEKAVYPYDVNEEGTESVKYPGKKPELIPGGEHVVTFPQSGRVIPHGRTMRMMSKGMIQPTEADPTSPAPPVSSGPNPPMGQQTEENSSPNPPGGMIPHRDGRSGSSVVGSKGRTKQFASSQNIAPDIADQNRKKAIAADRGLDPSRIGIDENGKAFIRPEGFFFPSYDGKYTASQESSPLGNIWDKYAAPAASSVFHATNIPEQIGNLFTPSEPAPLAPDPHLKSFANTHSPVEVELARRQNMPDSSDMGGPEAMYAGSDPLGNLLSTIGSGPQGDEYTSAGMGTETPHVEPEWDTTPAAPVVNPNAAATQAIMANRGVSAITPPDAQKAEFITPYGIAGVSHKMRGGKVSRTRTMMRHTDGR